MVLECDGSDGSSSPQVGDEPTGPIVHSELALEGFAKSLAWDTVGKRVVVAVGSTEPQADRLCLCETLGAGHHRKRATPCQNHSRGFWGSREETSPWWSTSPSLQGQKPPA